ncbi:MAG TPA: hypothetical protein VNS80_01735, partial [Pseudolysinimonas sp.]|nr:hypothetical protein [Pseudolysinimonas sp.]
LDPPTVSAASLGLVAELLLAEGRPLGPAEPLYLRAPDVTMPDVTMPAVTMPAVATRGRPR